VTLEITSSRSKQVSAICARLKFIIGEGKSVTLAVVSMLLALNGFEVKCACYSKYLSERDYQSFEAMFKYLELDDLIDYGTFNEVSEM
jgi:preprotein translocase subunit SecA